MDWREKLFGKKLVRCDSPGVGNVQFETVPTLEALNDCVLQGNGVELGIYFSFANISEASDDFPLRLDEVYRRVRPKLKIVEVVLWAHGGTHAGPAERETGFRKCLAGKPWFAVPFHDVDIKRRLTKKYNIAVGIPALVIRGRHVRDALIADPEANHFPWPPPLLDDVLKDVPLQRCDAIGSTYYKDIPRETIRMFYFAAHWCPPCRTFTTSVCSAIASIRRRRTKQKVQLIVVSSDRSEESFRRTVSRVTSVDSLAVPWSATNARNNTASALGVAGIPALVLVSDQGTILCSRGRACLATDPAALNFPWERKLVTVLTEQSLVKMAQHPAIVLFVEDQESELEFAESVLTPAAESYYEECTIQNPDFCPYQSSSDEDSIDYHYPKSDKHKRKKIKHTLFYIGVEGTDSVELLKEHINLDDAVPLLTAIDFAKQRMVTMSYGDEITTSSVQNFVDTYLSGNVEFKRIKPICQKC